MGKNRNSFAVADFKLRAIGERKDAPRCFYCHAKAGWISITVDHYIPLALGGGNAESNMVFACKPCNSAKGHLHPDEFTARKAKRPARRKGV